MTTVQTQAGDTHNETSHETRIVPARMAHLVLQCARRADTVAWYMKLFQAQLVFEDNVLTFITYDDEHHRLAFFNMPDIAPKQRETAGVHHIAYSYNDIGDLLATYVRLKPLGILPFWCINHGPTTSLYYRDPEGNDIELQADNGDDPGAYFHSEAFAKNNLGEEFDPDELVRMWKAGASAAELSAVGTAATGKSTFM
ncbi:VOC family protein [Paraburkholderia sp. J63]|uniref:VOC family protein n=1 Tax=Paraburkholderia sp. J63 TaxID=2805434 RepID=UPI002ABE2E64|nr:VOC family protein [Paraburkholderia sp. J63]